jgi:hypothetical protein
MTTLATLRSLVANDIRDPLFSSFSSDQVDSLINAGINEVSRFYPKEMLADIVPITATYSYATSVLQAFRLEMYRDSAFYRSVPQNDHDESAQAGWELWAGNLLLPKGVVDASIPATDFFRLWGYGGRAQLTSDAQVLDADVDGEWGVRMHARWSAFQVMLADRSLYKQWQAISQNSDISPTQLQQMVLLYGQEWDRQRNHLRRLRRV